MKTCENPEKRLMPPGYLLIALFMMVATHWLVPGIILVFGPVRLSGFILVMIGVLLNIAADQAMKKFQTPVSPFAKTTILITWGVYSWTRNPMYLGLILLLAGISVLMGSLFPMMIMLFFALLMQNRFVKLEEKKLADEFKDVWVNYSKRTRRWV